MHITELSWFKHKQIVIAECHNTTFLTDIMREAGAHTSSTITKTSELVILGERTYSRIINAKQRTLELGIPSVTEQQVLKLIRSGVAIKLPEASTRRSFDELFGHVRSKLQEPASADLWYWLIKKIDACEPERLPALVDYIAGYTSKWSQAQMHGERGFVLHEKELRADQKSKELANHRARGKGVIEEIRVLPLRWFAKLFRGEDSRKFHLVHALDLTESHANAQELVNALTHINLDHVHTLMLSQHTPTPRPVIKALLDARYLPQLERLSLGLTSESTARAFQAKHTHRGPTHLDLSTLIIPSKDRDNEAITQMLHAPYFRHVHTLTINFSVSAGVLLREGPRRALEPKLPAIETLELCLDKNLFESLRGRFTHRDARAVLIEEMMYDRVSTLRLRQQPYDPLTVVYHSREFYECWTELCELMPLPETITTLDVSEVFFPEENEREHYMNQFLDTLLNAPMLTHIATFIISPEFAEHMCTQTHIDLNPLEKTFTTRGDSDVHDT